MKETLPISNPYRHAFDGPVAAIATHREALCFAMGNQVFQSSLQTNGYWGTQRVACLPCGAMVTALACSGAVVAVGAGDRLFSVRLTGSGKADSESPSAASHMPCEEEVVSSRQGRVMAIRFECGSFVAVTAKNALIVAQEADLLKTGDDVRPAARTIAGPVTALVLAADCVALSPNSLAVFSGSYGGSIAVWSVEMESGAVCVHKRIDAHMSRCSALFSVRALRLAEDAGFIVATCSDDRSAAVLHAASLDETWRWLAREQGPDVAQTRVFDVALLALPPRSPAPERGRLCYALATEDGAVFVRSLEAPIYHHRGLVGGAADGSDTTLLSRRELHGGRGACRVALAALPGAVVAISGGFDGAVMVSTAPLPPAGEPDVVLDAAAATAVGGGAGEGKRKATVRCLCACVQSRATFFCIEHAIFAGTLQGSADGMRSTPQLLCSWEAAETGRGGAPKSLLPSAMALLDTSFAVIGTEVGYGIVCALSQSGVPTDSSNACVVLPTWVALKKVLSLRGVSDTTEQHTWWTVSSHAGRGAVVTRLATTTTTSPEGGPPLRAVAEVTHRLTGCDGLEVTCVELSDRGAELLVLVGDKRGFAWVFVAEKCAFGEEVKEAQAIWVRRVFATPVHTLSLAADSPSDDRQPNAGSVLYVTSNDGGFSLLPFEPQSATEVILSSMACASPLRLPFDVTRVLHFQPGVCVAQHGTSVRLFRSRVGHHVWTCVAEYADIRAPRLLRVDVGPANSTDTANAGITVAVTHCSDGRHVVTKFTSCDAVGTCADARPTARRLKDGVCTGKDFNCVLGVARWNTLVCGNEDSSISVRSITLGETAAGPRGPPDMIVKGPHKSNILAIAEVPCYGGEEAEGQESNGFRFVTVGGLSTATLWEWTVSSPLRVLATASFSGYADTQDSAARNGAAECFGERVARFMCVTAATRELVVVGSSDASLRFLRVSEAAANRTRPSLTEWAGGTSWCPNSTHPKPVMSVAVVASREDCVTVAAGDTNGRVYVVRLELHSAALQPVPLGCVRLEPSCVNALTQRAVPCGVSTFWMAAMHDSGNVRLLRLRFYPRDAEEASASSEVEVSTLDCVSTGVTAGRGIAWVGEHERASSAGATLAAVNDERLVLLATCSRADSGAADEAASTLRLRDSTRVTVRCVSGLDVQTSPTRGAASLTTATIVGQGIETIVVARDRSDS